MLVSHQVENVNWERNEKKIKGKEMSDYSLILIKKQYKCLRTSINSKLDKHRKTHTDT